jgi:hypothetical protein
MRNIGNTDKYDYDNPSQPNIGATYQVMVTTKDGDIRYKSNEQQVKCYCKPFHGFLINMLSHGELIDVWPSDDHAQSHQYRHYSVSVKDTAGVSTAPYIDSKNSSEQGAFFVQSDEAGITSSGIVVGSGITPTTSETHKMESIIPHGLEEGSLYYMTSIVYPVMYDGNQQIIVCTRTCENKTASPITVNEIGLHGKGRMSNNSFLLMRDVFDTPVTVDADNLITVVYKMLYNTVTEGA